MNILAIDASTEACSVALWHNDQVDCLFEIAPQQHTRILLPMVEKLLQQNGLTMQDLSAIAFAQGPGSFTGLRIAAGVAQGLALAQNLPLIPISTLAALAFAAYQQNPNIDFIAPVLDARMQEVYFGLYQFTQKQIKVIIEDTLAEPHQAAEILQNHCKNWIGVGSGIALLPHAFTSSATRLMPDIYPSAREVAMLAVEHYRNADFANTEHALPNYLRNDVVHSKS